MGGEAVLPSVLSPAAPACVAVEAALFAAVEVSAVLEPVDALLLPSVVEAAAGGAYVIPANCHGRVDVATALESLVSKLTACNCSAAALNSTTSPEGAFASADCTFDCDRAEETCDDPLVNVCSMFIKLEFAPEIVPMRGLPRSHRIRRVFLEPGVPAFCSFAFDAVGNYDLPHCDLKVAPQPRGNQQDHKAGNHYAGGLPPAIRVVRTHHKNGDGEDMQRQ